MALSSGAKRTPAVGECEWPLDEFLLFGGVVGSFMLFLLLVDMMMMMIQRRRMTLVVSFQKKKNLFLFRFSCQKISRRSLRSSIRRRRCGGWGEQYEKYRFSLVDAWSDVSLYLCWCGVRTRTRLLHRMLYPARARIFQIQGSHGCARAHLSATSEAGSRISKMSLRHVFSTREYNTATASSVGLDVSRAGLQ